MMELNLWSEEFQLAQEWGLDLPVAPTDSQFGDLKYEYPQGGDDGLSFRPGPVEILGTSKDEDALGIDWMESSDLGSFLDALGGGQDNILPFESSLFEYSPDDCVTKVEQGHLPPSSPSLEEGHSLVSSGSAGFEMSPPESPEQRSPVILVEPAVVKVEEEHVDHLSDCFTPNESFLLGELDVTRVTDISSSFSFINDGFIHSPVSVDDVESMLSCSLPSSPINSHQESFCESNPELYKVIETSNLIESSPELYKVISTSTVDTTKRFSPYLKPGLKEKSKGARKSRTPAQPVPDHIILEQVDKKGRKKMQNKNAAIRYRMKKKEEALGIKTEEQELEEINAGLKSKVEDMQREIRYMKNLMQDVLKAKGVL